MKKLTLIIVLSICCTVSFAQVNSLYGMNRAGQPVIQATTLPVVDSTGSYNDLLNLPTIIQGTKGTSTFSGISLQTSYVITHGLGWTPSSVFVQPTSLNAAVLSYVSAITSTNFTITFISAPVIGTNNISFYWVAYK